MHKGKKMQTNITNSPELELFKKLIGHDGSIKAKISTIKAMDKR